MTDQSLLNAGDHAAEPAHLIGYGPIPAEVVRRLLLAGTAASADAADAAEADVWVRRLFKHPETGQLAAIDSQARTFRGALRRLLIARDLRCRTPWCGAAIRHVDHVTDDAEGGATSWRNGEGLCEACNYAKTAPGWTATTLGPDTLHDGSGIHEVLISTPTGHHYRSRPPDPPRTSSDPPPQQRDPTQAHLDDAQVDLLFRDLVEELQSQLRQRALSLAGEPPGAVAPPVAGC
jgi:hypothetical protein